MKNFRRERIGTVKRLQVLVLCALGGLSGCVIPSANGQNVTVVDAANDLNTSGTTANGGCFSTIRSLNEAMVQKELFVQVVYNLCPDTIFSVGINKGHDGFVGEEPIKPTFNSVIRCGQSGSPQENCIIQGGDGQLQLFASNLPEGYSESFVVEGVTFQSVAPTKVAVALASTGFIDFRSCIFKNHNAHVVAILHDPKQQQEFLTVTFDSCVFEANSLLQGPSLPRSTLIYGGSSASLIIRNSVFVDNNLQDDTSPQSDIIHVQAGGDITMENNCFFNNTVVGDGVMSVIDGSDVLQLRGNFGTKIEGSSCHFLFLEKEDSCKHFDYPQCALDYADGVLTPLPPGFVPDFVVTDPIVTPTAMSSGMKGVSPLGVLLAIMLLLR